MQIHPIVQHLNSVVSVTLQAMYVGDVNDETDKARIAAYGDPKVNLAGTFVDPVGGEFTFTFPISEYSKGITTELAATPVRFMTQLPVGVGTQLPTDCITSDPVAAATAWVTVMESRIGIKMDLLRAKTPIQLTLLPDATV